MLPLKTKALDFSLPDTLSGKIMSLKNLRGKNATVIMFICNHCPFVIHVIKEIVQIANTYSSKGISFIAISSNDIENYPQDAPHLMKEIAFKNKFSFPYLYDESQEIAKKYDAACTPDFYVFDSSLLLKYRGQLDDSRPGNGIPITGNNIRSALDALLNNSPIPEIQKPSIGSVSYTHLRSPRDQRGSRMPSSA